MEAWEAIARESIRDLVARYNASGDSGRFDAVLALFSDDAVVEIEPRVLRGIEQIRSLFTGAVESGGSAPPQRIWHHTATLQIDIESQSHARGRCYFQVLTSTGLDHWGRYVDEYRCSGGVWRISVRRISVDGVVPGGWADQRRGESWGE